VCLSLLGCPPHHIRDYEYVGQKSNGKERGFEKLPWGKDSEILVSCFFYYSFIGKKDRAIITKFMTKKNAQLDLQDLKVKVHSEKLGELEQMELPDLPNWDSLPTIIFGRKVDNKSERKILKMLENDTITVSFDNGFEYHFVRTSE